MRLSVSFTALMMLLSMPAGLSEPATAASKQSHMTVSDPDDTEGKLDIQSLDWRVKHTKRGNAFVHQIRTYEPWDVSDFYLYMYLYERDPDFSKCYPDRCSGLWEGEIYWNEEEGHLLAYLFEDGVDCADCDAIPIRAWKSDERTMSFVLSEGFFYRDTRSCEAEFATYWAIPYIRIST